MKRTSFFVCAGVIAMMSCRSSNSSLSAGVDNGYVGGLGYAYDSQKSKFIGGACVKAVEDGVDLPVTPQIVISGGKKIETPDQAKSELQKGVDNLHKYAEKVQQEFEDGKRPHLVGGDSGTFHYESDMSFDEMSDVLNGSVAAGVESGGVSIGAGAGYAKKNASSDFTISRTVYVTLKGKSRQYPNPDQDPPLSSIGLRAAGTKNGGEARKICGDSYVAQVDYGASFMGTLRIEVSNASDKSRLEGYLDVGIDGSVGVSGDLLKELDRMKDRVRVKMDITQIGGDPAQMKKIFAYVPQEIVKNVSTKEKHRGGGAAVEENKNGTGADSENDKLKAAGKEYLEEETQFKFPTSGIALLDCGPKQITACMSAFQGIFSYASSDFFDQFNMATGSGLVPIQYHMLPYPSSYFGMEPLNEYDLQNLDKHRKAVLREKYYVDKDLIRIDEIHKLYGSRLSEPRQQALNLVQEKALDKIDIIDDALSRCFGAEALTSCKDVIKGKQATDGSYPDRLSRRLQAMTYDRSALMIVPNNFYEWCSEYIKDLSADENIKTIRSIIEKYRGNVVIPKNDADDVTIRDFCMGISNRVNHEKVVELTGVEGLEPLSGFRDVETLTVSTDEAFSGMLTLRGLTALRHLNLKGHIADDAGDVTEARGLKALAGHPILSDIFIEGSNASDLSPLASMEKLTSLRVFNSGIIRMEGFSQSRTLRRMEVEQNWTSPNLWDLADVVKAPRLEAFKITTNVDQYFQDSKLKPVSANDTYVLGEGPYWFYIEDFIKLCQRIPYAKCEDKVYLVDRGQIVRAP